jgi:sulfofructose kinase
MKLDVICVGSATIDTIAVVPRMPGEDGRAVASAFVDSGGGPAATAAVALARLGASVGFCGVVGDDDAGALVREGLEREGVRTDWLVIRPNTSTTRSSIVVSEATSGRMIITQRAGEPHPSEVPVGASEWLHADQTGIAATRAAVADSNRTLISVDAGNPIIAADLSGIELYAPTVESLRSRYPDASSTRGAVEAALRDGARAVVATDGPRGAVVGSASVDETVAAFPTDVVSTLGAGDVFHGALLAGLVRGRSLVEAAVEASAAAALSCRAIDGRSAIPTRRELDEFLSRKVHRTSVGGN